MESAVRRFACSQCGKCCNRSPEVELSEAATLADVFVFRLMFRLYWLPNQLRDYIALGAPGKSASAVFYQKKRLLSAFATRKYPLKAWHGGKSVPYTKYLVTSALALDTSPGTCPAITGKDCGIYDRRPLSCRSVPFHYSRGEALADAGLEAFVGTPGYCCDTGDTAEVVIREGRIVGPAFKTARSDAMAISELDRPWSEAIVRRMREGSSATSPLPTLKEIEASAQFAATTTSMCVAWQIAGDVHLIESGECDRLTQIQLGVIDRELAAGRCSPETRQTLVDMRAEYCCELMAGTLSPSTASIAFG